MQRHGGGRQQQQRLPPSIIQQRQGRIQQQPQRQTIKPQHTIGLQRGIEKILKQRRTWGIIYYEELVKFLTHKYGPTWNQYLKIEMGGGKRAGDTPYLFLYPTDNFLKSIFAHLCTSLYLAKLHTDHGTQRQQHRIRVNEYNISLSQISMKDEILYFKGNTKEESETKADQFFKLHTPVSYEYFGKIKSLNITGKTEFYFVLYDKFRRLNNKCVKWYTQQTNRASRVQNTLLGEPLIPYPQYYPFKQQGQQRQPYQPPSFPIT